MLANYFTNKAEDFLTAFLECQADFRLKLEDIAKNVQFSNELCVYHRNYQPFEPALEIRERFLKLPPEAQQKQTLKHLRSFLYSAYYNGSLAKSPNQKVNSDELAGSQRLRNESVMGIDVTLFQELHEGNSGDGYFDPGWLIKRRESDGWLAVSKGNLTVHVNPRLHLVATQQLSNVGEVVAIKMPKNYIQEGFYIAVGNMGTVAIDSPTCSNTIVRIYFNITSVGAVVLMKTLTQHLNQSKIFFSLKAPYNYSSYGRYDAGVLYINKDDYLNILPILQGIYLENQRHFHEEVPLFTKKLAPGLGLAEEPNHKFEVYESFGTNRCQILAISLLDAKLKNQNTPEKKLISMLQHLAHFKVDLRYPYLNSGSDNIYTSLQF